MGRNNKRPHKRKPGRCSKCKGLVAGHIGRPGKSCKNIPDNSFAILENIVMATGPDPDRPMANGGQNRNPGELQGSDDLGMSNINELRDITKGLQDCMGELSDRVRDLQREVYDIRRSRSRSRSSRGRDAYHGPSRSWPSSRSPHPPPDESHSPVRDSSRNPQPSGDWGPPPPLSLPTPVRAVVAPGDGGHPEARPVGQPRPRRRHIEPALRPVPQDLDLTALPLVSGISERSVRTALTGQYVTLDTFLSNLCVRPDDDKDDDDKSRQGKRAIYNILSWIEAWENYTRLMVTYHGLDMFLPMSDYKLQMLSWDKRYIWKACQSFDTQHRGELANRRSVNFMDIDSLDASNTFDNSVLKPFATRCSICRSYDHIYQACPFRGASDPPPPPPGAGRRSQSLDVRQNYESPQICLNWNAQRCGNPRCGRVHMCRNCGGNMPYDVCKINGKCAPSAPTQHMPNTSVPPPQLRGGSVSVTVMRTGLSN